MFYKVLLVVPVIKMVNLFTLNNIQTE